MKKLFLFLTYLFTAATVITFIECILENRIIEGIYTYIVIAIISFILSKIIKENKKEEEVEEILDENWKKVSNKFFVNENNREIMINHEIIAFRDIIDVKLEEDIHQIERTIGNNKSRGGVGIIIPSYTGNTKINTTTSTEEFSNYLRIKIKLNSISNPLVVYDFINKRVNIDNAYINKKLEAEKCVTVIENIIKNN